MNRSTLIVLISAVVIGLPNILRSQDLIQYKGPLVVGDYRGEASYSYRLEENDTILNGPFKMQSSDLKALLEQEDYSFSFTGSFEEDFPSGDWQFQFGKYKTERESEVVDYQYRVVVSGIQHEARGNILLGKPNGPWNFVVNRIVESEVEETLFKSNIEFDKGLPLKSFRIENTRNTLLGRCLRNGLAHDEWTLFANDGVGASESWYFDSGQLQKVQKQYNNQTEVINFYAGLIDNSKVINLDARYIEILKIKQTSREASVDFKEGLYQLLEENAEYYQKIDRILSELGESDFVPAFKVLVEHYPLDPLDRVQLDSIGGLVKRSKEISKSVLGSTQMSMLKLSDDQALYLYSVVTKISEEFLKPLEKISHYHRQNILEYISRNDLFTSLWPNGKPSVRIVIEQVEEGSGEGRTFMGPQANRFDFTENNLGSIHQMAEYTNLCLDSIQKVLNKKLTLDKRQQDLVTLEEELITQSEALNQLIDSLVITATGTTKESLEQIKILSSDNLNRYATMEDNTEKLDFGGKILDCHASLTGLANTIGSLQTKGEEIKKRYQDAVWNPFVAVVMEEEVKKRITTAYNKILIPHFLLKIKSELSCNNAADFSEMIDGLHKRMIEMREEDTSKLERKLKKEQDPDEILQLFGIKPMNGD